MTSERRISLAIIFFLALGTVAMGQPDVIVGEITGPSNYSAEPGYDAFSLGTTSCNTGNQVLTWIAGTNEHPVIGGCLYKIENGRFLQIGRSWLKHGFTALQGNTCNLGCTPNPNGTALGVGCSDPYSSGLNGNQSPLGPRYQVNASTGDFPYGPANPPYSGSTARRLRVATADLAASPGTQFIAEAQYIQWEDAGANVDDNNASYRLCDITGGPSEFNMSYSGGTQREQPAIQAWADLDANVILQNVTQAGIDGGLFIVASRRTENGNGTAHYEFAVHNLNVHDSAGSFQVQFPGGTTITNAGFHSTAYHSGEPYNNNPWTANVASNGITWMVDQAFGQNPNSNAMRWGSTFSFWFDADDLPTGATIGLYRSGGSATVPAAAYPVPGWQTNQPGATFDVDGATNDGFSPIDVTLVEGSSYTINVNGTAGAGHEIYTTFTDGIANNLVIGDQILNLDFLDSSLAQVYGNFPPMPGGGYSVPIIPGPIAADLSAQMAVFDVASPDGLYLSALNQLHFRPTPRVVVETVGNNSYNSSTGSGFFRVIHNGSTTANVTRVVFDYTQATGNAAGAYFDTDESGMNGVFNQGGTYRNGSATACGLDLGVSNPYAGSGFIATNVQSGASWRTIEFQFSGGLFNGQVFEFDADTDPGTQNSADHVGLFVRVDLSDGTMFSGYLAADTTTGDRNVVEFF